jgi:hypothetical protein
MLVLTSMIAYLLCISLYYSDSLDTGIRLALSVLMVVGLSQQIRSSRVSAQNEIDPATSRRTMLLLGLIGSILALGLATTATEWLMGNRQVPWGDREYANGCYRGLSTTWTLALFLSSLTSPWMAYGSRSYETGQRRSIATRSLVSLLCLCLLAITIISNGLIATLVLISCNSMLLGLKSPASILAQVPIDSSNRLLHIQSTSMWFVGLWTLGAVGCLALLASLYWTSQNSRSFLRLLRSGIGISVICLAIMIWVIGWWTREISPPIADSYQLMPTTHWITLLIPALLIGVYFVTRCPLRDRDATAPKPTNSNDASPSATHHVDGQEPIKTIWPIWSDSAWVGILWIALPLDNYKQWLECLPEIHTNPMRLVRVLELDFAWEDSRLHLFLALFGLQWMIRRIRWNGELAPRWPNVSSRQWSMIPTAWLTVIMLILVSVPFGIAVWFL